MLSVLELYSTERGLLALLVCAYLNYIWPMCLRTFPIYVPVQMSSYHCHFLWQLGQNTKCWRTQPKPLSIHSRMSFSRNSVFSSRFQHLHFLVLSGSLFHVHNTMGKNAHGFPFPLILNLCPLVLDSLTLGNRMAIYPIYTLTHLYAFKFNSALFTPGKTGPTDPVSPCNSSPPVPATFL